MEFYKQFIMPGDIVIDVGANIGNRAKVFSMLGAVVVAVEPQLDCSRFLRAAFKGRTGFHLVTKALGASIGNAEMRISNAHTISTLSTDWLAAVENSGRFAGLNWNKAEVVPVDTLDNVIAQHGIPRFIKIDVEGFEDQVIAGLSSPVRALSFEFTPEFLQSTIKCIAHLNALGNASFQLSLGESMEFYLPKWQSADGIEQVLSEASKKSFGDIYARFDV